MSDALMMLKLEFLCAQKDAELASLRAQIIVDKLRKLSGASDTAMLNLQTFTFSEPIPVAEVK